MPIPDDDDDDDSDFEEIWNLEPEEEEEKEEGFDEEARQKIIARYGAFAPVMPQPIDYRNSDPYRPRKDSSKPSGVSYWANLEHAPNCWHDFEVTAEEHRIIRDYSIARRRQEKAETKAARARWDPPPPPPEPAPDEVPPTGLTPRQEEFCRHYAAQPVATRAAVLAGFSEENASPYGSRLLANPLVLDRIAQYRAEKRIHYVLERDTMHDKLEALFADALAERNHAAAISALKLQAALAGMFERAPAAAKARKSQGAGAKKPGKAKARARRKPGEAKESQ